MSVDSAERPRLSCLSFMENLEPLEILKEYVHGTKKLERLFLYPRLAHWVFKYGLGPSVLESEAEWSKALRISVLKLGGA